MRLAIPNFDIFQTHLASNQYFTSTLNTPTRPPTRRFAMVLHIALLALNILRLIVCSAAVHWAPGKHSRLPGTCCSVAASQHPSGLDCNSLGLLHRILLADVHKPAAPAAARIVAAASGNAGCTAPVRVRRVFVQPNPCRRRAVGRPCGGGGRRSSYRDVSIGEEVAQGALVVLTCNRRTTGRTRRL